MSFMVDDRIESSSVFIDDFSLSRIFLKNNALYPWMILVPREPNIRDIDELSTSHQHVLMSEISHLSSVMKAYFKPDKLNVAALGNVVSQLHVHVVARFDHDELWPYGIWQASQREIPYESSLLQQLVMDLRRLIKK